MPIARRQLLGVGAAVVAAAPASAGQTGPPDALEPSLVPRTRPRVRTPRRAGGLPAPGHLYYGASLPRGRSLPRWERSLGETLALHRSYFVHDADETAQLVRRCRADLAQGRMPHVSIKPPGTWGDVASGAQDWWLTGLLAALADEPAPVFLTLHHEPENDVAGAGMRAADWVAMQRRAIAVAAERAPRVTIVPVLQHWTFNPLRDDADPGVWIVPGAAVVGLDVYNPWSPSNGLAWQSFGSRLDEVTGWFGDTPLAIGEYGCREDPGNPGIAAEWLRAAAEYAREHNVVSLSYFNSGQNSPDGTWELDGERERAFAELLASDWVARPPVATDG